MAAKCPQCKRYLAGASTCGCGWSAGLASTPPHPFPWRAPADPVPDSPPAIAGSGGPFHVRGLAVDGTEVEGRFVAGVQPIRMLAGLGWLAAVYFKGFDLVVGLLGSLMVEFLPLLIGLALLMMIGSWIGSRTGTSGCLGVLFGMLVSAGGSARRGVERRTGWDLLVDTGHGQEVVRVASSLPSHADQEVLVHGPLLWGRRHAWLVQGLEEPTFARLGRGLVGTGLLMLVLVPQVVWLLLR